MTFIVHSAREKDGPKGEVTLVFTDVQDSTRLWELDMNIMQTSIRLHNDTMRATLRETNGFEVKTEGDAVSFFNSHSYNLYSSCVPFIILMMP